MSRKPLRRCRHCHCTDAHPCALNVFLGAKTRVRMTCGWWSSDVCDSPDCVRREIEVLEGRRKEISRLVRAGYQLLTDCGSRVKRV